MLVYCKSILSVSRFSKYSLINSINSFSHILMMLFIFIPWGGGGAKERPGCT